jgi:hypothetical protein
MTGPVRVFVLEGLLLSHNTAANISVKQGRVRHPSKLMSLSMDHPEHTETGTLNRL